MKFMLRHSRNIAALFPLFPLTVFVLYAFWSDKPDFERFKTAFTIGGSLAGLQLVWTLWRGTVVNRVVLGVNLYLLVGALSFYLDWVQLGRAYDNLRETGVVAAITLIGVLTTFASPYGFVGVAGPAAQVRRLSLWMLSVAFVGCAISFWFRGNLLLSAAVPIIALQLSQRVLVRRYA
jgi:hypothetical protein